MSVVWGCPGIRLAQWVHQYNMYLLNILFPSLIDVIVPFTSWPPPPCVSVCCSLASLNIEYLWPQDQKYPKRGLHHNRSFHHSTRTRCCRSNKKVFWLTGGQAGRQELVPLVCAPESFSRRSSGYRSSVWHVECHSNDRTANSQVCHPNPSRPSIADCELDDTAQWLVWI